MLGDGWARGRCCFTSSTGNLLTGYQGGNADYAAERYELLFEMHILYEDGTKDVISSDNTWKCYSSHIKTSTIYEGEYQDSNLYIKDWNLFECDEKD